MSSTSNKSPHRRTQGLKYINQQATISYALNALVAVISALHLTSTAKADNQERTFVERAQDRLVHGQSISAKLDDQLFKYTPPGTTKQELLRFCNQNGLKPFQYFIKENTPGNTDEKIACTRKLTTLLGQDGKTIQLKHEIKLYFTLRSEKLVSALGVIFSLHL